MPGCILMVTRNCLHLTKKAVRSALSQDVDCELLVIDNCSTDGTRDWLKTKRVSTIYMRAQESLAYCWNTGLRAYMSTPGCRKVLIINNDIELLPQAFRLLQSTNLLFVTGVSVDTREQFEKPILQQSLETRPHPDFSCFMIHRDVIGRVGGFDEEYYPAYYEDNDYHVRMHRAGVRAVCVDIPFLHHGAATMKHSTEAERFRIQRGAGLNKERFRQKYGCVPGTYEYDELFL